MNRPSTNAHHSNGIRISAIVVLAAAILATFGWFIYRAGDETRINGHGESTGAVLLTNDSMSVTGSPGETQTQSQTQAQAQAPGVSAQSEPIAPPNIPRAARKIRVPVVEATNVPPTLKALLEKTGDSRLLSADVRIILGLEGRKNYRDRLEAIESLRKKPLRQTDLKALYAFLESSVSGAEDPLVVNAVKNDVLERLLERRPLPAGLPDLMVDMFLRTSSDSTWREYIVQHMPAAVHALREGETGSHVDPTEVRLKETLELALAERNSGIAGTALLAWRQLAGRYLEYPRTTIKEAAMQTIQKPDSATGSFIGALQVLEDWPPSETIQQIRGVAENPRYSWPVRMAALNAASRAQPDQPETQRWLQNVAFTFPDTPLSRAASRHLRDLQTEPENQPQSQTESQGQSRS